MSKKNRRNRNMQQSPAEKERARKRELLARELARERLLKYRTFFDVLCDGYLYSDEYEAVVNCDFVAQSINIVTDVNEWGNIFTCINPPFSDMFFQWNNLKAEPNSPDTIDGWGVSLSQFEGTLILRFYSDMGVGGIGDWGHGAIMIYTDGSGAMTGVDVHKPSDMDLNGVAKSVFIVLHCLALMNARNIELVDAPAPPPKVAQRYEREFGQPMTRYKVLKVNPVRKVYDRDDDGETDDEKALQSLHLVRGHFRHNENHPIPQFNGTFWIPSHARGSEQAGITVKDYKVESPDES